MEYEIEMTLIFKDKVKGFAIAEKKKVRRFIELFSNGGFKAIDNYLIQSYRVRNKSSDDVDKNDSNFIEKVKYAIENKLWHYHAGFYNLSNQYPIDNGYKLSEKHDLVSQWLIHYQKLSDSQIVLVDIMPHPPLNLLAIRVI
ncbi:MAG: hypothetical protein WAX77_06040 [Methylococcaceae bacterium]